MCNYTHPRSAFLSMKIVNSCTNNIREYSPPWCESRLSRVESAGNRVLQYGLLFAVATGNAYFVETDATIAVFFSRYFRTAIVCTSVKIFFETFFSDARAYFMTVFTTHTTCIITIIILNNICTSIIVRRGRTLNIRGKNSCFVKYYYSLLHARAHTGIDVDDCVVCILCGVIGRQTVINN